jgi:hypothetical protein
VCDKIKLPNILIGSAIDDGFFGRGLTIAKIIIDADEEKEQ